MYEEASYLGLNQNQRSSPHAKWVRLITGDHPLPHPSSIRMASGHGFRRLDRQSQVLLFKHLAFREWTVVLMHETDLVDGMSAAYPVAAPALTAYVAVNEHRSTRAGVGCDSE